MISLLSSSQCELCVDLPLGASFVLSSSCHSVSVNFVFDLPLAGTSTALDSDTVSLAPCEVSTYSTALIVLRYSTPIQYFKILVFRTGVQPNFSFKFSD